MSEAPPPGPQARIPETEAPNPASAGIDSKSALEIVTIIHNEDLKAWEAAGEALPSLAKVVEEVVRSFQEGGRIVYVGAGTSGRLGVLDAAECLPTFSVGPERIHALIAGGEAALREPVEGAEDSTSGGADAIRRAGIRAKDVVCGIAASGTTPFVWGALEEAAFRNATTVLITCNKAWREHPRADMVDLSIEIPSGPEIIAGSTRMKAGTATKLVLNSLSTAAMIRWGKVYDNLMVDVKPLSQKLERRALGLISRLAGVALDRASELLSAARGSVKAAVLMERTGVDEARARDILEQNQGILRRALEGEGVQD